ncbi:MAG TPA: NYN domain-containing protein [Melioribacteraceae bacterium]|nr:NYN domain-containing protein [Melioribacteraceae bacterium]
MFVDVQNIYYTTKEYYNLNFNYKTFIEQISESHEIIKAFAYAIDKNDHKQKQFQRTLESFGFEVKLKPFIKRGDGSAKGDWDVGITIDILEYAPISEKIILLSGDGDFYLLVKKVIDKYGVIVEVFGVKELTADSIINSASIFTPITKSLLF